MQAILESWYSDSGLPPAEILNLQEMEENIILAIKRLQGALKSDPWTIQCDISELYYAGKYAPNKQLGFILANKIVPALTQKIKEFSEKDATFVEKFKAATSKCVLVLLPDAALGPCTAEFKDGKLIYHIQDLDKYEHWGNDLPAKLATLTQQKGVKMSCANGMALKEQMHRAPGEACIAAVRKLIELELVDLPMSDNYDYPIFELIGSRRTDLLPLLLPHVKNINVKNFHGETPLLFAAKGPFRETPLLPPTAPGVVVKVKPVYNARLESQLQLQPEIMKALLARPDIDVNAVDKEDMTAFMYVAATKDWNKAAEVFIADPRVDFFYENRKMQTALDLATKCQFEWLVKWLTKQREQGVKSSAAPVNASNGQTKTGDQKYLELKQQFDRLVNAFSKSC